MGIHIKKTDSGKACVYLSLNAIVVRFDHLNKTIKGGGRGCYRHESINVERGVDKGFDCPKIRLCISLGTLTRLTEKEITRVMDLKISYVWDDPQTVNGLFLKAEEVQRMDANGIFYLQLM